MLGGAGATYFAMNYFKAHPKALEKLNREAHDLSYLALDKAKDAIDYTKEQLEKSTVNDTLKQKVNSGLDTAYKVTDDIKMEAGKTDRTPLDNNNNTNKRQSQDGKSSADVSAEGKQNHNKVIPSPKSYQDLDKNAANNKNQNSKQDNSDKAQNLKNNVSEKASDLKQNISGKAADLKQSASDKVQDLKNVVADKGSDLKQAASDKVSDLKQAASDKVSDLKKSASDKGSDLKQAASNKVSDLKQAASDKVSDLKQAASDKVSDLKQTVSDKGSDLKQAASDKVSDLKQTATNKVEDLKKSTNSNADKSTDNQSNKKQENLNEKQTTKKIQDNLSSDPDKNPAKHSNVTKDFSKVGGNPEKNVTALNISADAEVNLDNNKLNNKPDLEKKKEYQRNEAPKAGHLTESSAKDNVSTSSSQEGGLKKGDPIA